MLLSHARVDIKLADMLAMGFFGGVKTARDFSG